MAVLSFNSVPSTSTTTYFKGWAMQVSQSFATLGWVQASDTGQINWSTVVSTGVIKSWPGFEIWKMNDPLQSSCPCFVKVTYGTGPTANAWAMQFQLGLGSDGVGNLIKAGAGHQLSSNETTTGMFTSYVSGDNSRIAFLMHNVPSGSVYKAMWGVERDKDINGLDIDTGLILQTMSRGGYPSKCTTTSVSKDGSVRTSAMLNPFSSGSNTQQDNNPNLKNQFYTPGIQIPTSYNMKIPGKNFLHYFQSDFCISGLTDGGFSIMVDIYGKPTPYRAFQFLNAWGIMQDGLTLGVEVGDIGYPTLNSFLMRWE